MKAIILAGGFAKRMWPITKTVPKMLLPIAGRPLLDHLFSKVEEVDAVDEIYISTNKRFASQFLAWKQRYKPKKATDIVVENTVAEGHKLGAIKAICFVLEQKHITEDCLIVFGDNLFEFGLDDLIKFSEGNPTIGIYDVKDRRKASLLGVVSVDNNAKIVDFEEKPLNPKSTLASAGAYFLPKSALKHFDEYLAAGNHPDTPGYFIKWLYKRITVKGFLISGKWYDIGDKEIYQEAQSYFS